MVDLFQSGRPKSVTTEQHFFSLAQNFVHSPSGSTHKVSSELGISLKVLENIRAEVMPA